VTKKLPGVSNAYLSRRRDKVAPWGGWSESKLSRRRDNATVTSEGQVGAKCPDVGTMPL
jgi:hypothetical protein